MCISILTEPENSIEYSELQSEEEWLDQLEQEMRENSGLIHETPFYDVYDGVFRYEIEEASKETITTGVSESIESRADITLCAVPTMKKVV